MTVNDGWWRVCDGVVMVNSGLKTLLVMNTGFDICSARTTRIDGSLTFYDHIWQAVSVWREHLVLWCRFELCQQHAVHFFLTVVISDVNNWLVKVQVGAIHHLIWMPFGYNPGKLQLSDVAKASVFGIWCDMQKHMHFKRSFVTRNSAVCVCVCIYLLQ